MAESLEHETADFDLLDFEEESGQALSTSGWSSGSDAETDISNVTSNSLASSSVDSEGSQEREKDGVFSLPEIVMDNFDLSKVAEGVKDLPIKFFLTRCTKASLGQFLSREFLESLESSGDWKVYTTEMIYGYLVYLSTVQTDPWKNEVIPHFTSGYLDHLTRIGRIVPLRRGHSLRVDLSHDTEDCGYFNVTWMHQGYLSQILKFALIREKEKDEISVHEGTVIPNDIFLHGCYPSQDGFPLEFERREVGDNYSELSASKTLFSRRIKKLSYTFHRAGSNYHVQFNDCDKLVELWYLRYLCGQFSSKIHVPQPFMRFVENYVSQFSSSFTCNADHAKIHYGCTTGRSSNQSCPGVPRIWGITFSTISINGKAERCSDVNLPFIHESETFH